MAVEETVGVIKGKTQKAQFVTARLLGIAPKKR
jgi:hypothetical protein